jgi:hypothetical protein
MAKQIDSLLLLHIQYHAAPNWITKGQWAGRPRWIAPVRRWRLLLTVTDPKLDWHTRCVGTDRVKAVLDEKGLVNWEDSFVGLGEYTSDQNTAGTNSRVTG